MTRFKNVAFHAKFFFTHYDEGLPPRCLPQGPHHPRSTPAYSINDHIFVSQSLSGYSHKYYSICDEVDNQSDHVPSVMTFQLELEQSILTSNLHKVRTSWQKANSDHNREY